MRAQSLQKVCQLLVASAGSGMVASTSSSLAAGAEAVPPTTVWAITLERCWNEQRPVVVTLYERDGRPIHGYAMVPSEGSAVHRVDLGPAAPTEYLLDGQRFHPPENLKRVYDYLKPEFVEYRKPYMEGKLLMRNYDVPPPVRLASEKVRGVLDLFFLYPDARQRDRIRVRLDAKKSGASYQGRYAAFDYSPRDEKFSLRTRWEEM